MEEDARVEAQKSTKVLVSKAKHRTAPNMSNTGDSGRKGKREIETCGTTTNNNNSHIIAAGSYKLIS